MGWFLLSPFYGKSTPANNKSANRILFALIIINIRISNRPSQRRKSRVVHFQQEKSPLIKPFKHTSRLHQPEQQWAHSFMRIIETLIIENYPATVLLSSFVTIDTLSVILNRLSIYINIVCFFRSASFPDFEKWYQKM